MELAAWTHEQETVEQLRDASHAYICNLVDRFVAEPERSVRPAQSSLEVMGWLRRSEEADAWWTALRRHNQFGQSVNLQHYWHQFEGDLCLAHIHHHAWLRIADEATDQRIASLYTFRDDDARGRVARFIEQYPTVATVLLEAREVLRGIFPEGRYWLDVRRDPDIDDEQLVLSIGVRRDPIAPRDALKRLLSFQDAWGIDADQRTEGRITVILESL